MDKFEKKCVLVLFILFLLSPLCFAQNKEAGLSWPHTSAHSATILENFNTNVGLSRLKGKNLTNKITPKENENGKWGYANESAKFIINPILNQAFDFNEYGLAQVEYNKRWGLLNRDGLFFLIPFFSKMSLFDKNGISLLQCDTQIWSGLELNKNALKEIPTNIEFIKNNPDVSQKFIYTYITSKGHWLNGKTYIYAEPFMADGVARIVTENGVGILKRDGDYLFEPQYSNIGQFSNGIAAFKPFPSAEDKNPKYGFISLKGDVVFKPVLDSIPRFINGLAIVSVTNENDVTRYGILKNDLTYLVSPEYNFITPFNDENLALAEKDGNEGYINASGEFVSKDAFGRFMKINGNNDSQLYASSNGVIVKRSDDGQYYPVFGMDYLSDEYTILYPDTLDRNMMPTVPSLNIGLIEAVPSEFIGICENGLVMAGTASDANYIDESESTYDNDGVFFRLKLLGKEGFALTNILDEEVERFAGDSIEINQDGLIYTFYKKLNADNTRFFVDRKINMVYIAYMAYEQNHDYDEILVVDRYDLRNKQKLTPIFTPIYEIYRCFKNGSIDFKTSFKPIMPAQNDLVFNKLAALQVLNVGNIFLSFNATDQEDFMCVVDNKSFDPISIKSVNINSDDFWKQFDVKPDTTLTTSKQKYCVSKYGGYYLYCPDGKYIIKFDNMGNSEWQNKISDNGKISINNLTENNSLIYCIGTSQEAPFVNNNNAIAWEINKDAYVVKMIPLTQKKNTKSYKGFIKNDYLYVQTNYPK